MKTRVHPLWLIASLAVLPAAHAAAGEAAAADPQSTSADAKVAIDPKTGKTRPLTAGESRALEAQSKAKARRVEPMGAGKKGFVMPATEAEAAATRRTLPGGGEMQQVPESTMSTLMVVREADGSMRMYHEGEQAHADAAKELPNE